MLKENVKKKEQEKRPTRKRDAFPQDNTTSHVIL